MGREFDELFDEWALNYDGAVAGHDEEYAEVFSNYQTILETVAGRASGMVVEIGVGTGNLTQELVKAGYKVYGVEPSEGMRVVAKQKLPEIRIVDGDFLAFSLPEEKIDSIVSTYAFHHLTDQEKNKAIEKYAEMLGPNGKIVFADTIFLNEAAKAAAIKKADSSHFLRLAADLRGEYYTIIPIMTEILTNHGFAPFFHQLNPFVWLIEGIKNNTKTGR